MTWEEKFMAIDAISPAPSLRMRKPGEWYIHTDIDRKQGSILSGGLIMAASPEGAVEQWWEWAIDERYYLVTRDSSGRLAVRWNGYMWARVNELSQ